jgi:hypothetical protein
MPIRKNASMDKYIKDFEKSDAPQFKGKSKDKRVEMAVAAKLQAMGKKMQEYDYGTVLSNNLMPGADVLKKYVDIVIRDPKIAASSSQQEFTSLLRDKVERAHFLGNKDEVSKAAEYLLSLSNNAGKYSDTMTRVYNMIKGEIKEAKATLCGRCGHVHVKGTPCPRPFKEGVKPDFLDLDKDGNKTEPMEKAAKDAKAKHEVVRKVLGRLKEGYDFFEKTMDDDTYVDVSGPSVEMTMEEILTDFEERIKGIPEESRGEALRAIKTLWINMIKGWNPDLTTPHRAPVTEAKHPILEAKEYDYEGQMARTQLISIVKNAKSLFDSIGEKTQLQSWVQSKLTKAEDYLNGVRSYLDGESISNTTPLMVNNQPAKDDEGTALSVGDVVRGADGRIYQAVHSYSEGKAFLTPFDLKKRKTTNLSQRHYFDTVAEDEMSPTMKMYKVMPHTQTKGGFTK